VAASVTRASFQKISRRQSPRERVTVVEFMGLPGAGKSTTAESLVTALRARGVDVRTNSDFIAWLSSKSRFYKVMMVLESLPTALKQVWRTLLFAASLRPVYKIPVIRIILLPMVNCWFDQYIKLQNSCVVVTDQANMQRVWSLGAYAKTHGELALEILCRVASGRQRRLFVFIDVSPSLALERIRMRPPNLTRFDKEPDSNLPGLLKKAVGLMSDIVECLVRNGESVLALDAATLVPKNVQILLKATYEQNAVPGKPPNPTKTFTKG
jgi:thymidylate kinase